MPRSIGVGEGSCAVIASSIARTGTQATTQLQAATFGMEVKFTL